MNEKRSTTGPITRFDNIPATPPQKPVRPTVVATSRDATVSPMSVMKFVIQMPCANMSTDMSPMARAGVPASAAKNEAGVSSAATSMRVMRARCFGQPRATNLSEA